MSHELRTPLTTIQGNLDLLGAAGCGWTYWRGAGAAAIGDQAARMRRLWPTCCCRRCATPTCCTASRWNWTPCLDIYRQA